VEPHHGDEIRPDVNIRGPPIGDLFQQTLQIMQRGGFFTTAVEELNLPLWTDLIGPDRVIPTNSSSMPLN
jgi:hypothetical protein